MGDDSSEDKWNRSWNETEECVVKSRLRNIIMADNLVSFQTMSPKISSINELYLTYKHYFFASEFKCFDHLISLGLSINIEDCEQKTPIFDAILEIPDKNYRRLTYFLHKGANLEQVSDIGETPIMFALKNYKLEIAYWLSRKNVNLHVVNEYGKSLLHYLLSHLPKSHRWAIPLHPKFKKLLRKLLQNGVSPYELDDKGRKPIDYVKLYPSQIAKLVQKMITKYYCELPEIKEPE